MLYALKGEKKNIIAVSVQPLTDKWQPVDASDEALQAFLKKNPSMGDKVMQEADADFIRVLEDVIDLLIDKQIIRFTEFPDQVQEKLLNRRRCRESLRNQSDVTHLMDGKDDWVI